jgi:hypothetical protein
VTFIFDVLYLLRETLLSVYSCGIIIVWIWLISYTLGPFMRCRLLDIILNVIIVGWTIMLFPLMILSILLMRIFIKTFSHAPHRLPLFIRIVVIIRWLTYLLLTLLLLSKIEIVLIIVIIHIIFTVFFIILNFFIKWSFSGTLISVTTSSRPSVIVSTTTLLLITFFSMFFLERALSYLIYYILVKFFKILTSICLVSS